MMIFNPLFLNNSANTETAMGADLQKANKNGYLFSDIIKVMMSSENIEDGAALPMQQATLTDKVEKNVLAGMPVKLVEQVNIAPDYKLAEEILTDIKQLIAVQSKGNSEEVVKELEQLVLKLNTEETQTTAEMKTGEFEVDGESLKTLLNKIIAKVNKHADTSDAKQTKETLIKIDIEKLEKMLANGESIIFTMPSEGKQLKLTVTKEENGDGYVLQVTGKAAPEKSLSLIDRLINAKSEPKQENNTFTIQTTDKGNSKKTVHDFVNNNPKKEIMLADNGSSAAKEKPSLSSKEMTATYTDENSKEQSAVAEKSEAVKEIISAAGNKTEPEAKTASAASANTGTAKNKSVSAEQVEAKKIITALGEKPETTDQSKQKVTEAAEGEAQLKTESEVPSVSKAEGTKESVTAKEAVNTAAAAESPKSEEKVIAQNSNANKQVNKPEAKIEAQAPQKAEVKTAEPTMYKERIEQAPGTAEKKEITASGIKAERQSTVKQTVDTETENKIISDIKSGTITAEKQTVTAKGKSEVKGEAKSTAEIKTDIKPEVKAEVPKTETAKTETVKTSVQTEEPDAKAVPVKEEVKHFEQKAAVNKETLKEIKADTPKADKEMPLAKESKETKETVEKTAKPEMIAEKKHVEQKEESKSINIKVNRAIKGVNVSKGEQSHSPEITANKEDIKHNVKAEESDVKVKADAETVKHVEAAGDKQKSEFTFDKESKHSFGETHKTGTVAGKEKPSFEMPQTNTNERVVRTSEIMKEISKFVQRHDKNTLTLRIDPEHLGKLKLTIDVVENAVKANVEVESAAVKHIVESNLSTLNSELAKNGIQLSSINISLSDQDAKQSKQFANNKKKSGSSFEKDDDSIHEQEEIKAKQLGYNTYEYLV